MPSDSTPAHESPPLTLTPEPSPSSGDGRITRAQLAQWHSLYGVDHRQLRRWVQRGLTRNDPVPLDTPALMLAWIERNLDRISASLRERVTSAAQSSTVSTSPDPAPAEIPPAITSSAASDSSPVSSSPLANPLDLATVGGVEGESVEFFRTIFAAVKLQLTRAYELGNDHEIRKLHTRLKEVGESLRKHEKDAEQRAIRLGAYLDKAEAFNEITQALNILAQLRELRKARVRNELADLPPETLEKIDRALDLTGLAEEDVLRHLSLMHTPADVSLRLAA